MCTFNIEKETFGIISLSLNVDSKFIVGFDAREVGNVQYKGGVLEDLFQTFYEECSKKICKECRKKNKKDCEDYDKCKEKSKKDENNTYIEIFDVLTLIGVQNFAILFRTNENIDWVISVIEIWNDSIMGEEGNVSFLNLQKELRIYIEKEYSNFNFDDLDFEKCPVKNVAVTEYLGDKLIPVYRKGRYLDNSSSNVLKISNTLEEFEFEENIKKFFSWFYSKTEPTMLFFMRIYRKAINRANNVNANLATPEYIVTQLKNAFPEAMWNQINGIFFGFGLYDLVISFDTVSYNEIQYISNTIRSNFEFEKNVANDTPYHPISESSTMITFVDKLLEGTKSISRFDVHDHLDFSVIAKIWAGYEKSSIWEKIINIGNSLNINCNVCESVNGNPINPLHRISFRQGLYDVIINISNCNDLKRSRDFICILGSLIPFIQSTSTLIKFPSFINRIENKTNKDYDYETGKSGKYDMRDI